MHGRIAGASDAPRHASQGLCMCAEEGAFNMGGVDEERGAAVGMLEAGYVAI